MKVNTTVIDDILSPLSPLFKRDNYTHQDVSKNPPLRAELFSTEQMDQHAQQLAISHSVVNNQSAELLLKELSDNESILYHVNGLLQKSVKKKRSISPAGEWLLDNFYLIEEQIRTGKRHLPKGYSKGLPKLKTGQRAGYPRVYDIAIELISHSDGHVDIDSLNSFITSYQKQSYLTLGELWAIPIMIRLALLENLSRVAVRIAVDRNDSALANEWARKIIDITEENPKDLVLVMADMARSKPPMVSAFVAEFSRKLQWKGQELSLPLNWIEQHLSDTGETINSMVLLENQKQAADQVSVSNSINSLRFLAKTDWREFVEQMSIVEKTLQKDSTYSKMDFYTRDYYRHKVEKIASYSGQPENCIAELAIDQATLNQSDGKSDVRKSHVGYYLIDNGAKQLEQLSKIKVPLFQWIGIKLNEKAYALYVIISILIVLVTSGAMMFLLKEEGHKNTWLYVVVGICSLIASSQFALALANWISTLLVKPKLLPKLDFSKGIPDEYKTLVIVPTILANVPQVEKLVEELEVRFLANRDENLLFGLLSDFKDAPSEVMPTDTELTTIAVTGIQELNKKYGTATYTPFVLLHRPRLWNAVDKVWMGYERKRGKLADLNHLLRGHGRDKFAVVVGDEHVLQAIKYVITLDTDTQLPRYAAWRLVGTMAHPLNRPVYNEEKKRVVEGFAIIQPRIAISLHGATRSGYTLLHENDSGIDPYTRVTSDVYQDVFGEGSFIGKGIYDVDAFEESLNNRFPENRILSHDLLEGSYARSGFVSDIQFYEDYPSHYALDVSRRHRWIRGDWQIANWFLPFVPGPNKKFVKNSVSALSRWKIFDNLRRSLVPVAIMVLLLLGWALFSNWGWTIIVLLLVFLPTLITSTWSVLRKPQEVAARQHITNAAGATSKSLLQSVFTVLCLPYEAFISIDAIIRTLWRINISHKRMLEWNPSGFVQRQKDGFVTSYLKMWICLVLPAFTFVYLFQISSPALWIATPLLFLWILSPAIVNELGRPLTRANKNLKDEQRLYLRELSRKTWSFFEHFVNAEDNWLPPDNFQQYPIPVIAHRTSPTNIGLALLGNLSAYDFGYITSKQLMERTQNTFASMDKLERYRGHFYNWYDTQTLGVLNPHYVSTVDSGNLAGHLLTLRQGFIELPARRVIDTSYLLGLRDTLRVTIAELPVNFFSIKNSLEELYREIPQHDLQLPQFKKILEKVLAKFQSFEIDDNVYKDNWWLVAIEKQLNDGLVEINHAAPWLSMPIPEKFQSWSFLYDVPTFSQLERMKDDTQELIKNSKTTDNSADEAKWLDHVQESILQATEYASKYVREFYVLASKAFEFADMEYEFLYDRSQHLLSIGYNVDDHRLDNSFYDLLASESRLSLFVGIAQGKLPQDGWFALGRRLTSAGNTPVLLSWSGSMFEYLMPTLVMPTYKNTLLDEMAIGTVKRQIEFGNSQGIPWGISESCYNLVDANLTYQYKAFGVPGLGLKRGLGQDLVISPYATVLALMVDSQSAYSNLKAMKARGFEGKYGFYEAIDYTPVRLSKEQHYAIIQTFMVHHQGMSLLSLAYLLLDQPMQRRFESDIQFQTALLLLQEQVPKASGYYAGSSDEEIERATVTSEIRVIKSVDTQVPEVHLLSNGRYFAMLSNTGCGYNRWKDIAVTRWREDGVSDNWGSFCYIRDNDRGELWSNSYQPTLKENEHYEAIFSQGKVEYRRRDNEIETYTTVIVSPEDDVEVRRILLTNHARTKRTLSITSYGEVVLTHENADNAHPAFSNLFVQTEIKENQHAIVCTRRPRSKDDHPAWMFHLMKVNGVDETEISYETDRSKFIGRGKSLIQPQALESNKSLSGSQGSVLDPIVSVQYKIVLPAGGNVIVDIVTGVAESQDTNQWLIDKYQDRHLRDRAFELSWTHSQIVLRQIGASEAEEQLFGKLASSILYLNPALRAQPGVILKNHRGQSALWSYSISGDLPIVLLYISEVENINLVKQLIKAQAYWHMKGLAVDLVILNEDAGGYRQVLQEQINGLIAAGSGVVTTEKQGRIFVRPSDQVSSEDKILLQTVARVIISDKKGSLEDQVNKRIIAKDPISKIVQTKFYPSVPPSLVLPGNLQFFNETGGFSADGTEYVMLTTEAKQTPLPWINVIANNQFGTIVSESGSSYTWFENAHEYRLTPWKNDPTIDGCGEVYYLRDEDSGQFWSPLGLPVVGQEQRIAHHGFGYSSFESQYDGIVANASVFVDTESPIKFVTVTVENKSGRPRRLSLTGYVEWVLAELRSKSALHIVTELESSTGAIVSRNKYNSSFQNYVSFFDVDESNYSFTTDRAEFIGRNGNLFNPDAMTRTRLSGKLGAGFDSCAAIQVPFELESGAERKIVFKLGSGRDLQEVVTTLELFQEKMDVVRSLETAKKYWNTTLNSVQVETPDQSINLLANGWLLYQVISCRLWGRSGFYQSGGAFGYRDQLQDTLAVMHAQPHLTRKQIIACASRQFVEGDVQHWWHPPQGRGVRTLCSDDFLWLPFVTSRYISLTGDIDVLDEVLPYLQGRQLNPHEESYYDMPSVADKKATLYDHCKQAITHALRYGEHGLPFMGAGDWNDGMNMVGIEGKGESVWLAFFLHDVLNRFSKVAALQDDTKFVATCEKHAKQLKKKINENAWDGEWYLRAFFDDGTPIGSKQNEECRIDAISQSWAVLSGAGETERIASAMQAANKYLINREKGLIQLLEPPFDKSSVDPGYIKGYVPGVRENGGQYTHSAIWMVMAFARLGDQERTAELINLINPINHARNKKEVTNYKVEPYVMAADVYSVSPHTGRGGWTWYTGSAGWMYQLILDSFLGLNREGDTIHFEPCVPVNWKSFSIRYRFKETWYKFNIVQDGAEKTEITIDGTVLPDDKIQLVNDKNEHEVTISVRQHALSLV